MNGGHDLGGMHGFGPVAAELEAREPRFHAAWERRVFALNLASGFLGRWTLDASRYARERQLPWVYQRNSYYENWLAGLEALLVEAGLVTREELASGIASGPAADVRVLRGEDVAAVMATGGPVSMDDPRAARFGVGERVRVRNRHPLAHTRAPRYARGRSGVVEQAHGVHVFADRNAQGDRVGEHLYGVRFSARELWGEQAGAHDSVRIDLWEPYLERAAA